MSNTYSNYPFTELPPCFIALVVNLLAMSHYLHIDHLPTSCENSLVGFAHARCIDFLYRKLYAPAQCAANIVYVCFPNIADSFVTLDRIRTFSNTHAHRPSHRSIELRFLFF